MSYVITTATEKITALTKRIRAVSGGQSASKTISILFWLIDYGQTTKNELISVVSQTFPHLAKGSMLDFENIMKDTGYWKDERWNMSKSTYTFETGSKLEFFSPDTYGKAHGPRRDILFMNEAWGIDYKIADQLITRTRKIVWMDWNPTIEFWFYTEMLGQRDDIDFLGDGYLGPLTYLDNEALDEITIKEIESHKNKKQWWRVYGLGKLGEVEGKIYKGWNIIDEIPHEARLVRKGMDFGYSIDPTVIVDIYQYNGGYILDEILYRKGLLNSQIADILLNCEEQVLTIADSAEPKSIDEIANRGITILGSEKGADSVKYGIDVVQNQRISITKRSLNIIREYNNYLFEQDKNGKFLPIPQEGFDHSMDAIRYAIVSMIKPVPSGIKVNRPAWKGYNRR